jgi:hypothetical protein
MLSTCLICLIRLDFLTRIIISDNYKLLVIEFVNRDSSVGIATGYGLYGLEVGV